MAASITSTIVRSSGVIAEHRLPLTPFDCGSGEWRVFSHGPGPAFHALACDFFGALLGFGIVALVIDGASGSALGIAAAAAVATIGVAGVGLFREFSARQRTQAEAESEVVARLGPWFVMNAVWLILGAPVSAYLAPRYELKGLAANLAAVALVPAAVLLVYRASPWRHRWRKRER
jgi:hypothetical protein